MFSYTFVFQFQAGLKKIPNGPNMFALVVISAWNSSEIPSEVSIKTVYKLIKRKKPDILEFGPGYGNQLQNWLCKPQNRESDLISIDYVGGKNALDCHGIETEIVLNVGSTCKQGCSSLLSPVAMTRAKSMLILSKFETQGCVVCNASKQAFISQPHLTPS